MQLAIASCLQTHRLTVLLVLLLYGYRLLVGCDMYMYMYVGSHIDCESVHPYMVVSTDVTRP